jgi:hypothetical protein
MMASGANREKLFVNSSVKSLTTVVSCQIISSDLDSLQKPIVERANGCMHNRETNG